LVPHLAWLVANDFAPFATSFAEVMKSATGYLLGAGGYFAIPFALILLACRPNPALLVDMLKPASPARRFAATAFWVPLLLPVLVAIGAWIQINSLWTAPAWTLLPVVLLSSPLISLGRPAALCIAAFAVLLPPVMTAAAPAIVVAIHRAGVTPVGA